MACPCWANKLLLATPDRRSAAAEGPVVLLSVRCDGGFAPVMLPTKSLRVGPTQPTRLPRLSLTLCRLDRRSCCRAFFVAQRLSPSAGVRVRLQISGVCGAAGAAEFPTNARGRNPVLKKTPVFSTGFPLSALGHPGGFPLSRHESRGDARTRRRDTRRRSRQSRRAGRTGVGLTPPRPSRSGSAATSRRGNSIPRRHRDRSRVGRSWCRSRARASEGHRCPSRPAGR
jgi:hypothetical protein